MKKKGKKKLDDRKLRQLIFQDQITPGESASVNDEKDDPDGLNNGVELLEKRIRELKYLRDNGAETRDDKDDVEMLPLLEVELKVLKARMIKKSHEEEYSVDDENEAAIILASRFGESADRPSRGREEREYFESLPGFLDTWKGLASERRKEGSKSFMELEIDKSDGEGTRVFDTLKEAFVHIGTRICDLITEYLWLCAETLDDSETAMRTRIVKDTVLKVRLEASGSPVVKRVVDVIETMERNIRALKDFKGREKVVVDDDDNSNEARDDGVPFSKRESRLLGSIFFYVLNFEAAFRCPSFPEKLENKDLVATSDFLRKLFEEKFNRVSSELNEFKKACKSTRELEELRRATS